MSKGWWNILKKKHNKKNKSLNNLNIEQKLRMKNPINNVYQSSIYHLDNKGLNEVIRGGGYKKGDPIHHGTHDPPSDITLNW